MMLIICLQVALKSVDCVSVYLHNCKTQDSILEPQTERE